MGRQPISHGHVAEKDPQRISGKKTNRSVFSGFGKKKYRDAGESQVEAADVDGCHQRADQLGASWYAAKWIGMGDANRLHDVVIAQQHGGGDHRNREGCGRPSPSASGLRTQIGRGEKAIAFAQESPHQEDGDPVRDAHVSVVISLQP